MSSDFIDDKNVPVLFLIFNRPDSTRKVFEAISKHKPKYLFIAADGARIDIPGEEQLCIITRDIATRIDWDCEVKTLFRTHNLGCKIAVSSAISWFFEWVSEGIILEDDCLPDDSFFPFCAELLDKYRDEENVFSISGSNLLGKSNNTQMRSYFRGHGGIWGWATWKRAWNLYDIDMKGWPEELTKNKIRLALGTQEWYQTYYSMFESSHNQSLDTWDIQWFYSILVNNGIALNPSVNLVKNIGFDAGTHINSADNPIASLPLYAMTFPLKHPGNLSLDVGYLKAM
jgi:hypothetical protein